MTAQAQHRQVEILLVEDNSMDANLLIRLFEEHRPDCHFHWVVDGAKAMDFLLNVAESPRPDVLLLDLNLPKKDGREVLREMKADTALRSIPVIIVTSSNNPQDMRETMELGARAFITKPTDLTGYESLVARLADVEFELAGVGS